jgi:hypothetical protein
MHLTVAISFIFASEALSQGCSPLHLVYGMLFKVFVNCLIHTYIKPLARATTELPQSYGSNFDGAAARYWSKGYGAAGYSLYSNVTSLIQGATGYPVHYPAAFSGNSQGDGVSDMVKQLTEKARECPQQKFAIGGHSQGGFVTTSAIAKLPQDILVRVIAVTMFGAPACPSQVRGRCISYCQSGDTVCASRGGERMVEEDESVADAVALIRTEIKAMIPDCARFSTVATSGLGKGGHLGYK